MDEKQKFKKRIAILLTLSGLLLVGLIAGIVVMTTGEARREKYYETVKRADDYVRELDYSAAIREYESVLTYDDTRVDIYQKLAILYESENDLERAKEIAIEGYQKTGDQTLSFMIANINSRGSTGYRFSEGTSSLEEGDLKTLESKNQGLIFLFRAESMNILDDTYEEFSRVYGSGTFSMENGYSVVDFGTLKVYYPADVNSVDKAIAYTGSPVGISYSSLAGLFSGEDFSNGLTYEDVTSAFSVEPAIRFYEERGIYCLIIDKGNYKLLLECDANGNVKGGNPWNLLSSNSPDVEMKETETTTEAEEEEEDNYMLGSIAGKIKDAVSGANLTGVHLTFRKGSQTKTGSAEFECDTGSDGKYYAELADGNYCVQVSKSGYIDQYESVTITRGVDRTGQDFIISTTLASGQIRIVLEWGAEPLDLDSYLNGSNDSGTRVYVDWQNQRCSSGSSVLAEIDLDDRDGYGPETTTLYDINGVYDFWVEDFNSTGMIGQSGAKVTIYLPDNTVQTININTGLGDGNRWNVCHIDHGSITVLNN